MPENYGFKNISYRRLFRAVAWALLAAAFIVHNSELVHATTVSGTVRDSGGNAVSGAAISFRLINIGRGNVARGSGTSIVTPALVSATSAADGTFSLTLVGNDAITPAGTLYEVVIRGPGFTYGPFDYSITGSAADLNSLTPEATFPNTSSQVAASQLVAPAGCAANQVLEWTGTAWACAAAGSGSGAQHQVNGTNLITNTTINFENSAPANGLTMTFANPSAGNVQLGLSGTLTDAGLASSYSGTGSCAAHQWIFSLTRNGAPTCSQPAYSDISGTPTLFNQTIDANGTARTQRPSLNFSTNFAVADNAVSSRTDLDLASTISSNTSGNAATATALASAPAQCTAGQFATGVAASGNANCGTPSASVPNPLNTVAIQDKGGQVYNVKAYGAKGDGVFLYNCSITAGTAALTCASGTFASTDVGKHIEVDGAGASAGRLLTTISVVTDATHLTVAANASATTSTANVVYGTDDGPAVQALITTLSASGGTMFFPKGIYIINNSSDANGFILDIPYNTTATGQWITYQFEGPTSMAPNSITTGVNKSGAVLYDMSAAVTGFIGAASQSPWPLSDVYVVVRNLAIVTPPTQNYSALHFQLAYNADVFSSVISPNYGPKSGGNVPTYGSSTNYGIYLPEALNAGFSGVFDSSVVGYYYGVRGFDHAVVSHCFFDENKYAILVNSGHYTMWLDDVSIQHSLIGLDIPTANLIFGNVMFESNTTDIGSESGGVTGSGFLMASASAPIVVSNLSPNLLYVTNSSPLHAPVQFVSYTFATLPAVANGLQVYCSDCKNVTDDLVAFDSAAASGGHGTTVLGENGAWRVH